MVSTYSCIILNVPDASPGEDRFSSTSNGAAIHMNNTIVSPGQKGKQFLWHEGEWSKGVCIGQTTRLYTEVYQVWIPHRAALPFFLGIKNCSRLLFPFSLKRRNCPGCIWLVYFTLAFYIPHCWHIPPCMHLAQANSPETQQPNYNSTKGMGVCNILHQHRHKWCISHCGSAAI